jgi:serine/threonine protein kinase
MGSVQISDCRTDSGYLRKPGQEPLPGYVLIQPLGRGGFGEVWKCEAPGGLLKAMKFVAGSDETGATDRQLLQEYEAFQQIKAIRHLYLLCLERVELIENELIMVMGLADKQLGDRFQECRQSGLPGIPREELLGYLQEAAEALDVISDQYGLQHLDVKPTNLFLTAGHVQVGDYGLVSKHNGQNGSGKSLGLTPRYAAPEVLRGEVHTQSDQYSLALVYQELLTGIFPYSGRTIQQLMLQHVSAVPDLSSLPEHDRGPVATALSKQPNDRFVSCRAFIKTLLNAKTISSRMGLVTPGQKSAAGSRDTSQKLILTPAPPRSQERPALKTPLIAPSSGETPTERDPITEMASSIGAKTLPGNDRTPPPTRSESDQKQATAKPNIQTKLANQRETPQRIILPKLLSVVPVERLRGEEALDPDLPPLDMVRAILHAASSKSSARAETTAVTQLTEGSWACRFLTSMDTRMAKVKLDILWEYGGLTMDTREERRVVFRKEALIPPPETGLLTLFAKKKPPPPPSGFELVVELSEPGTPVGAVHAHAQFFGSPPPDFVEHYRPIIVALLEEVREHLNNFDERRKQPRIPADFPLTLFPVRSDHRVESPSRGRCVNVSEGGLALWLPAQPRSKYAYVAFEGVPGTSGLALLFQILRTESQKEGVLVCGKHRPQLQTTEKQ